MIEIEFNKKEVKKLFLNEDVIGKGAYGILKRFDLSTVAKVYYRDFPLSYQNHKINLIDMEIALLKDKDKEDNIWRNSMLKRDVLIKMIEQLKNTTSADLMKGIITYNQYPIAFLLKYYEEYVTISDIYSQLSYQEKKIILNNVETKILSLWNNLIFPTDFKESNFMVRKSDLDVKLIDLDDHYTKYLNVVNKNLETYMLKSSEAHFQKFKQKFLLS